MRDIKRRNRPQRSRSVERRGTQSFYWIKGFDPLDKRMIVSGPYYSYQEAMNTGVNIDGEYEIVTLNTKDKAKATQIMKHGRLMAGDGMHNALSRAGHDIKSLKNNIQKSIDKMDHENVKHPGF